MAKRRKAKKMAQRGATRKEIKKATGFSGKQAQRVINNYRPAPAQTSTTSQTPTVTPPPVKGKGVRQRLRIAGVGGISGSDLKTIRKATGKSNEQLIRKLDKINKNLRSKDKVAISLNSGALNSILKKATKKQGKPRTYGFMPNFGTGKIGQDIMSRMGDPGSAGRYVKGQLIGAREATEPRFLAGGMQIRPGGRERVRGFGKQYELPGKFKPKDEVVDNGGGAGGGAGGATVSGGGGGGPVMLEPQEPVDTSLSSGAGGLDLTSWATGFRRARSSRQRAGRKAQGTGSMKNLKFKQHFT